MITFIKQNKVLTVIVAVFVFGVVYYAVFVSKGTTPLLSTNSAALGSQTPQSQQMLIVLANLRTIQLNQAVFVDPTYLSLNDFGVLISPESVGRRNPFATFAPIATTTQQIAVPSIASSTGQTTGKQGTPSTNPRPPLRVQ